MGVVGGCGLSCSRLYSKATEVALNGVVYTINKILEYRVIHTKLHVEGAVC